jgi:hypothetical protein
MHLLRTDDVLVEAWFSSGEDLGGCGETSSGEFGEMLQAKWCLGGDQ